MTKATNRNNSKYLRHNLTSKQFWQAFKVKIIQAEVIIQR